MRRIPAALFVAPPLRLLPERGAGALPAEALADTCSAQGGCKSDLWEEGDPRSIEDCLFTEPACLRRLNASSGLDLVPTEEVMAVFEKVGREGMHSGGVLGTEWVERFSQRACQGPPQPVAFPETREALEGLRARLQQAAAAGARPLLVHADELTDGLGARFKKAVELVAAALQIGFHAAALALPPAGSALHPAIESWQHGAVWCHESPAGAPADQDASVPNYPLICWRFDVQGDLLAQDPAPEGRILLWGAPGSRIAAPSGAESAGAHEGQHGFSCFKFAAEGSAGGGVPQGAAWSFLRREGLSVAVKRRLFDSVRAFAALRREARAWRGALCGFGGPAGTLHVALHLRRGDVGDASGYAVTQQLGEGSFSKWLCHLAAEAGPQARLALHVYTEAKGMSREAFRRNTPRGFAFPPAAGDEEAPVFHTTGRLDPPAPCDAVLPEVHVVVNNNPREALLCMARADVLVTSFSSLGWVAAVLNNGTVYHPHARNYKRQPTHWDLREQHLDWADNWRFVDADTLPLPDRLGAAAGEVFEAVGGWLRSTADWLLKWARWS